MIHKDDKVDVKLTIKTLLAQGVTADDVTAVINEVKEEQRKAKIKAFLDEVLPVMQKHGLSLSYCSMDLRWKVDEFHQTSEAVRDDVSSG